MSESRSKPNRRQQLAEENLKRVRRMKAEWKYLQNIRQNFDISHLETLTKRAEVEAPVNVPKRPSARRSRSPRATSSPPPPTSAAESSDVLRVVRTIPGPMRAAAVTQGGATIWVAEPQGGITIRSGTTTEPAVEISTASESVAQVLYPTQAQMWVGFESGTVHVYNHLVFMFVTEGTFHSDAVTAFVEMDDGRVFSASADGSLVKWEGAEHNFEAVARILPGHSRGIACLCGSAHGVFSGSLDGSIVRVDADTGRKITSYDAHRAAVQALTLANDYLFSGDALGAVVVWNVDSAEILRSFEPAGMGAIVAFVSTPLAEQLWEVTAEGGVVVRSTLPDVGFDVQRTIASDVPFQPIAVVAQDAIETSTVWTMSSNGVNKVWSTSNCSAEAAIVESAELMRDVVNQDTSELERWKGLLARLKSTTVKRRNIVVESLSKHYRMTLMGRYMANWRSVAAESWRRRRMLTTSRNLMKQTQRLILQRSMNQWLRGARHQQKRKLQRRAAGMIAKESDLSLMHRYYSALSLNYRISRQRERRRTSAAYLGNTNAGSIMQRYATTWVAYAQKRKTRRVLKRYMSAMVGSQDKALRYSFFLRWMEGLRFHRRSIQRRSLRFLEMQSAKDIRLACYVRWMKFRGAKRRYLLRAATSSIMRTAAENRLRQQYWIFLTGWVERAKAQRLVDESLAARQRLLELREKHVQMLSIIAKKRRLQELQHRAAIKRSEIEAQQRLLVELQSKREELSTFAPRSLLQQRDTLSPEDFLEVLMQHLKGEVINTAVDQPFLKSIQEKIRSSDGIAIFIDNHKTIKRVISEATKRPLTGVWSLTPDVVKALPAYHTSMIVSSLKAMVCAFDSLTLDERSDLASDRDLGNNAESLMLLAQAANVHRRPPPRS